MLILLQDDPDPDGIASGLALRTLLGRNRSSAPLGSFGELNRPENVAMSRLLGVPVEAVTDEQLDSYDHLAMVDVQPAYFEGRVNRVDLVIDHHPWRGTLRPRFRDVRTTYGAVSTILTEYLVAAGVPIVQRLATALFYGIKSDTMSLDRESSQADVEAFAYLYPMTNRNLLRRIERPEIPVDSLDAFASAFRNRVLQSKVLFLYLGKVSQEYVVPQLADFALLTEGVEWSVVSGIFRGTLIVCVRNTGYVRNAGEVVRRAFGDLGSAGGHRSLSRAAIPLRAFRNAYGKANGRLIEKVIVERVRDALGVAD